MYVTIENNGKKFLCTARVAAALESLLDSNGGGFATVKGYTATTGYVTPETADINFISRFSTESLYERRLEALDAITLADVIPDLLDQPKIKALTISELQQAFEDRKAEEIASMNKTLEGDRSDNRRAAVDRNFHTLANGVKVNFVSEKGDDGQTHPVLDERTGLPVVGSVLLSIIEASRKVIVEGTYKPVNSGVPVLISNAIKAKLPKTSKIKYLALKEDNFESLSIGNSKLMPKDFKGL